MKSYRRILVAIFTNGQSEHLLHVLQEVVGSRHAQVQVVRMIEPDGFAEPDGPAAAFLPEETAARDLRAVRRRLELQLSRLNLGWVDEQVIWRQPCAKLAEIIRTWQPDLIITGRRHLPVEVPADVDILATSGRGLLKRLAGVFMQPTLRHA